MSKQTVGHSRKTNLRQRAISVAAALSIAVSSAGLLAMTKAPVVDMSWADARPTDVTPVPANQWVGTAKEKPVAGLMKDTTSNTAAKTSNLGAVAVAAAPAGGGKGSGDFAALPGVASGEWGTSAQSGAFTWSYPFSARKGPAGDAPAIGLSYDSSTVDGLTSSTNNQASVVGDGWNLSGAGSIQQKFVPCMDQGITGSYDLCGAPGGQSFTISFGGRSGKIIKDATSGVYKLQNDDNTKLEYLTAAGSNGTFDGGYWKLTDTAGVQYFFGKNRLPGWNSGDATTNSANTVPVGAATSSQPCSTTSFAASLCQQAYAWNLDYVVDLNGNSQAFYYTQDKNNYTAQAGTGGLKSYDRASRLVRIDYGMRVGSELSTQAPLNVAFGYTGRCTGISCTAGTDVPTTFTCAATGTCATLSATFYTDQRLQTVTTQTLVGSAYQKADVWTLNHTMPNPGDGLSPALWLSTITHQGANTTTGVGGAITDPPVVFGGQALQNRVWVLDGLAQLNRYRIASIKTVTGATISVTYSPQECSPTNLPASPETNTKRCFPQWWAPMVPIAQAPRMDYFHIYPVSSVSTNAGPGSVGSVDLMTSYQYVGSPAWKYAGPKYVAGSGGSQLTWSTLAGWSQVKTITGNVSAAMNPMTIATYLRGLDGTPSDKTGGTHSTTVTATNGAAITDAPWLAGSQIESQSFVGNTTTRLGSSITIPWASAPTATGTAGTGADQARHLGTKTTIRSAASGQSIGTRTLTITNTYDSLGRLIGVSESPETGSTNPSTCTTTTYADNTNSNVLSLPATATTREGACGTDGSSDGDILRATRTLYDGSTNAIPGGSGYLTPGRGNATRSDTATAINGSNVTTWQTGPTIAYDSLGRTISSTDMSTGVTRTTNTAFTPGTGLPVTTTTTNPLGWTRSSTVDAVRGSVLNNVDENGNTSTYRYDANGRVTGAWDPMRPVAANPTPTTTTTYKIQQAAPSWVQTASISGNGMIVNSFEIYDGLGRVRQTQNMSPAGGTIATDTFYNSLGSKSRLNNKYYMSGNPSGTLMTPTVAVPSSTTYDYDGAGRPTKVTAIANDNQTLWTTSTSYTGTDTSTITGPGSDAARRVVVDISGNVISRLQYKATTATGTPEITTYQFDALGQNTGMQDAAGNTWTWTYDAAGRQIKATDPDTGVSLTSYDASGRAATKTNTVGTVTSTIYDSLDRTISQSITAAGGTAKMLIEATFDGEKKGQISSMTRYNGINFDQPVVTEISGYNAMNLPKTIKTTLPSGLGSFAGSYTTTQYYSKSGQKTSELLPALGGLPTESVYYGFDEFENPSSISTNGNDTIAGNTQYTNLGHLGSYFQYDANNSSPTLTTTGVTRNYFQWDALTGRLASQWSTNTAKSVIADLGKTSYGYAPNGSITTRSTTYAGRPGTPTDYQCYNYDYAERLAAVWTPAAKNCSTVPTTAATTIPGLGGPAPYAQTYSYTASGDRNEVKRFSATGALAVTEKYNYKPAGASGPHQLQTLISTPATGTATTSNFEWDAAGKMTNRSGQTLNYTLDGLLSDTIGTSTLPANPNPSAGGGTPPTATSSSTSSSRYYDASGNLVGIVDGTGTTITLGARTAHKNATTNAITASCTYTFAGKTVAQRTLTSAGTKLNFIISDGVDTAQTLLLPTSGTTNTTAITRYTDPYGLARGTTQAATGSAAYITAAAAAKGIGTNAANPAGFGAYNGYIGGLADTASILTHLGARDLDPVTGTFTTPDPVFKRNDSRNFSAYQYGYHDPINKSDPSGLAIAGPSEGIPLRPNDQWKGHQSGLSWEGMTTPANEPSQIEQLIKKASTGQPTNSISGFKKNQAYTEARVQAYLPLSVALVGAAISCGRGLFFACLAALYESKQKDTEAIAIMAPFQQPKPWATNYGNKVSKSYKDSWHQWQKLWHGQPRYWYEPIPDVAQKMVDYLEKKPNAKINGVKLGGTYMNNPDNDTQWLPPYDTETGLPLTYKEYDVVDLNNPKTDERGAFRIVKGFSNGTHVSTYFTSDHYFSFTKVK